MYLYLLPVPPGPAINFQVVEFSLNVLQLSEAWWVSLTVKAAVSCIHKIITRWWRVKKQENPNQNTAFHQDNRWMGELFTFLCSYILTQRMMMMTTIKRFPPYAENHAAQVTPGVSAPERPASGDISGAGELGWAEIQGSSSPGAVQRNNALFKRYSGRDVTACPRGRRRGLQSAEPPARLRHRGRFSCLRFGFGGRGGVGCFPPEISRERQEERAAEGRTQAGGEKKSPNQKTSKAFFCTS